MSAFLGTYVVSFLLLGFGIVFVVGWAKAFRFRHPYVGFLGIALITFGVRQAFQFRPLVESALLGVAWVLLCWTAILMAAHSYANYRRAWAEYEKDRERRAAVLMAEVQELARRARKPDRTEEPHRTESDTSQDSAPSYHSDP
ncbi:MAG TPA: hypothetical protein PLQ54_03125 [Armatimonadota bacterium]|nr:hypothetical protein [Armatimonadota bacterium]